MTGLFSMIKNEIFKECKQNSIEFRKYFKNRVFDQIISNALTYTPKPIEASGFLKHYNARRNSTLYTKPKKLCK